MLFAGGESQAAGGRFQIADCEGDQTSTAILVDDLVRQRGNGGRLIDEINREQEGRVGSVESRICDDNRDESRPDLVGSGRDRDSPVGATAAENYVRVRHQHLI